MQIKNEDIKITSLELETLFLWMNFYLPLIKETSKEPHLEIAMNPMISPTKARFGSYMYYSEAKEMGSWEGERVKGNPN